MSELPDVRVGDADREQVADALRHHAGEGRLEADELEERLGKAYSAKTKGELSALTTDLPAYVKPLHPAEVRHRKWLGAREAVGGWVATNGILVAIWAASGAGSFWPVWVMIPTAIPIVKILTSGGEHHHDGGQDGRVSQRQLEREQRHRDRHARRGSR